MYLFCHYIDIIFTQCEPTLIPMAASWKTKRRGIPGKPLTIIKESHIYILQLTFFFLFFCRLWPHPSPVSQMGRSRTNCSRCLCMLGSAGHAVCYSRIHNVPWYSGGQIVQPRTLLHHSGRHLLGLLVHFLSDCKASTDLLLPSANWHRPLTGYELFCSGN